MGNKRGVFSVKSAYYIALPIVENSEVGECSGGDSRICLWKQVWQLQLPAKVRIFAWRACLDGLPTRLNLAKKGLIVEAECPLYEKATESTSHAFIYCDKLCEVWWNWQGCPINLLAENLCLLDLALKILDAGSSADLETLFATAWAIWWAEPPPEIYKINVDGATAGIRSRSTVGVAIRDSRGVVVAAACIVLNGDYGATVTEAFAVDEGIRLAMEMELHQIIAESDSIGVVDDFNECNCNGEFGMVIQGSLELLRFFRSWKVRYLKRDYNRAAHELAHIAKTNGSSQQWKGMEPPMIRHVLLLELNVNSIFFALSFPFSVLYCMPIST
ncbi:uncharacterized protein LOC142639875 [Castanea sativa]|uniref:uncharacterized protein LOC142639875 n=1 Tax=Castanea sativa TaxID=21020 RepID=UPI003F6535D7